jgi:hypothetical protein
LSKDIRGSSFGCFPFFILTRRGEAEVIRGKDLAPILKNWIEKFREERPSGREINKLSHSQSPFAEVTFFPVYKWLEQETEIGDRRLRGIAAGEFKYVSLKQADEILSAIGHPELMQDLEVIANPQWTQEEWVEYMQERGCY